MKRLSEKSALEKLLRLKSDFAEQIKAEYEHKAKSCLTCETKGACCLDAHFVNVHITKLEAAAIHGALSKLPDQHRAEVYKRAEQAIIKYNLSDSGDTFSRPFACPLFEKNSGCLVHSEGKPLPCIQHACYERREDLPPNELLSVRERRIEFLNKRTYAESPKWMPLPIAIQRRRGD